MFYKVPYAAVPDLVARRQVLLRAGCAYVREAQVSCCKAAVSARPKLQSVHGMCTTGVAPVAGS